MSILSIQAKTGLISVKSMSKLRKLLTFSAKLVLNQLKLDNCIIQGPVGKIKEFIGQELRSFRRSRIRNIKETFPPKTGMRKATSCKIQGMSRWSIHAACCMVRALIVFTVNVETVDTGSNYIVYHSSKSSNCMKIWIKALY